MDMGIVNAGSLTLYDDVEPELRERVEDVLLNRREDATERCLKSPSKRRAGGKKQATERDLSWREKPVKDRWRTRWCTASTSSLLKTLKRRAASRAPAAW
jgi:5-methyltetrahydrofolate--homocysteine methyltransferase